MENKLELKHLAPYLPYGIKIKTNHGWEYLESLSSEFINIGNEDFYEFHEIKPYLRPLSNLIKEIEHNGEKFVPIIELFRMIYKEIYDVDFEMPIKDFQMFNEPFFPSVKVSEKVEVTKAEYNYGFSIEYPNRFCFTVNGDELVFNQLNLLDKLSEWHFDWKFGLIEKGLAIEK